MGTLPMPATQDIDLVAVLASLGDPSRLEIVGALAQVQEAACGELLAGRMAKSTRSHHLRVLREAGVIATRAEGTHKFSRLRRDDLDARFPGLLTAIVTGALAPAGVTGAFGDGPSRG
ncbi:MULTISPECIES: helix-turn-helix transcriptional regulator [unclassified Pseudofrankia]|uniref:ArsR/SmtB family transcription factor n=1 Tax=unclassified Pseudofrankia TaxID=2994372 RepID=UPI0008D9BC24|nr:MULTISPECIES: helix-turn-helix transcriptional regulator [unclassified Pseudofrankia]MDT3440509.1 helix-turn-helix transcriptional regulator [Pseudofrankia sp. BMG5.37]OHV47525.1 ArsR family transcriptional regulator [Pseudofrankia sp. BMG5.36]